MDAYGLEPERFSLLWCSSAEAQRFVSAVSEMTDTVTQLGRNPLAPASTREVA